MRKLLLLAALGLCSCDTDDEAAGAVQKCQTFKSSFCTRAAACNTGTTATACEQSVSTVIDCGQAVAVGESYDRCVQEISTFECSVLFPSGSAVLPASCRMVIKVRMQ